MNRKYNVKEDSSDEEVDVECLNLQTVNLREKSYDFMITKVHNLLVMCAHFLISFLFNIAKNNSWLLPMSFEQYLCFISLLGICATYS
jgi:hypothetical protein